MQTTLLYSVVAIYSLAAGSRFISAGGLTDPELKTRNLLLTTEYRLQNYANYSHVMPATLADLPARPNHDDTIVDAWGKPLLYIIEKDGRVTIGSLGADSKGDGEGTRSISFIVFYQKYDTESKAEWDTFDCMDMLEKAIRNYCQIHGKMPNRISELPADLVSADGGVNDGWGRAISYTAKENGFFKLSSQGPNVGSESLTMTAFIKINTGPTTQMSNTLDQIRSTTSSVAR